MGRKTLLGLIALIALPVMSVVVACGDTVSPTATPSATYTPVPVYTVAPTATATVTSTPTAEPTPTATARPALPTATPTVSPTPTPRPILSPGEVIEEVKDSIVRVNVGSRQGSGFVIDETGHILTSSELIPLDAANILVTHATTGTVAATLVGRDERKDVALIRLAFPTEIVPLSVTGDTYIPAGEQIVAVGYPGGAAGQVPTGMSGTVQARHESDGALFFQIDTRFTEGLTGAPIFNLNTDVVGIVSPRAGEVLKDSLGSGASGHGLGVSIGSILDNVEDLKLGASCFRPHDPDPKSAINPIPSFPRLYQGTITINGQPAPIGTIVQARVAGYVTGIQVIDETGVLPLMTVQPPEEDGYVGEDVQFYVNCFRTPQTGEYVADMDDPLKDINLTITTT